MSIGMAALAGVSAGKSRAVSVGFFLVMFFLSLGFSAFVRKMAG
jgi:hypothetical protein